MVRLPKGARVPTGRIALCTHFNSIVGDGATQLSTAVLSNTKIEVFNQIPINEMRADSLTTLDLSDK